MRITGYHQTMIFQDHKLVQLIMGLQYQHLDQFSNKFCGNGKQAILYCLSLSKLSRILCFVDYFTILYHDGVHYFNFVFTVLYFVVRH